MRALTIVLLLVAPSIALAQAEAGEPVEEVEADEPRAEAEAELPPEDPSIAEARRRFQQGVALARAGDCRGALAELNASLVLLPRPNTLYNIAQCQEELHRYDLAVEYYGRYLEQAPEDDPERIAVRATMRALSMLLGTIRITSSTPAQVWLVDRVVGESPGEVLLPGGLHVIELRADGFIPEQREVQITAQRTVELHVTLRSAEEHVTIQSTTTVERPPLPTGVFFGGVGVSIASLAVGIYFGVNALKLADAASNRPDPRLPPDIGAIEESALFADILFITAAILAAGTLVIAFVTDWGEADEDPEAARIRVSPLGLEGQF